jgi:hypothetical protein
VRRLSRRAPLLALGAALTAHLGTAACASMGMPPGGTVTKLPPMLLKVTPDTNALHVKAKELVFRFDKVVSERPRGATTLGQLVVVSPSDGPASVDWRRQAIAVRPRKGWRPNTAYTVTILPGLSDLFGNALNKSIQVAFSTGGDIPHGAVRGIAFDWSAQRVAVDARVEAVTGADTSFRYIAATDSTGRFALTGLPAGTFRVRVYADQNRNASLDPRELWDSITVAVADSARRDFYLFPHDTVGPRLATVEVRDSVSLRVRFDKGLAAAPGVDAKTFSLRRVKDSSVIVITRAVPAAQYDSIATRRAQLARDSTARADTSKAGRAALARSDSLRAAARSDSIAQAQIAARRAARDTTRREPLPKPGRPAPLVEFVLDLAEPLVLQQQLLLSARDLTSLSGVTRSSERVFSRRPPPKDTTSATTKRGASPTRPGSLTPPATRVPAADSARLAPKKPANE